MYDELYDEAFPEESWVRPDIEKLEYAREKIADFGDFLCENAERVLDSEAGLTFDLASDFCDSEYDSFNEWRTARRAV